MSSYISLELQQRIRQQFKNCCAYCQTSEHLTVTQFEFEHIIPRSLGGQTEPDNLCLSCPSCNRYKASRIQYKDPLTHQTVNFFHPQKQKWLNHFQWTKDFTEIQGLTPVGRATITALKMNRPQLIRVRSLWIKLNEHPPLHSR